MTVKFIVLIAIIVVSNLVIAFLKNQTKFRTSLHGKYLLQIIRLLWSWLSSALPRSR